MQNRKSILYIIDVPITERDYIRYGINKLSKNFDIKVIQLTNPAENNYPGSVYYSLTENYYFYENLDSLKGFIKENAFTLYIDLLSTSNFKTYYLRLLLNYYGALRLVWRLNEIPNLEEGNRVSFKIKEIFKNKKPFKSVLKKIYNRLLSTFTKKANFALLAGNVAKNKFKDLAEQTFSVSSMDYDLYFSLDDSIQKDYLHRHYAVFLDQSAPNHPDYKFHGITPPVTAEKYYTSLERLFAAIESRLGLDILIAAHPKNTLVKEIWNGREVVSGETAQAIKHSKLVLAHYTTAISFAVLSSKPILQLTSNEYQNSIRNNRLIAFKKLLNLQTVNIDDFLSEDINEDVFRVDQSLYRSYIENFLRSSEVDLEDTWDLEKIL